MEAKNGSLIAVLFWRDCFSLLPVLYLDGWGRRGYSYIGEILKIQTESNVYLLKKVTSDIFYYLLSSQIVLLSVHINRD